MKLDNFLSEKKEDKPGTFVGAHFSAESKAKFMEAMKAMDVPNPLNKTEMHLTLIYSRKNLPEFKARGKMDPPIVVKAKKLNIFPTKDKVNALVVELDAPEMVARHESIMKEHGATYDYDKYIPHITLSYNCGDFDVDKHNVAEILGSLEIIEEYDEELELEWVKKNEA